MKYVLAALAITSGLALPASPEPMDDALYIVDAIYTRDQYKIGIDGMADILIGSFENDLQKEGLSISPDAAAVFLQMMSDNMLDMLVEGTRQPLADAYVLNLSPETLSAYRAFLETEEGQEVSANLGALTRESLRVGEMVGAEIAEPAVAGVLANMEDGEWPVGTLKSTQFELRKLFDLPPVSEMPPER